MAVNVAAPFLNVANTPLYHQYLQYNTDIHHYITHPLSGASLNQFGAFKPNILRYFPDFF
jgi:hypothetical protein